MEKSSMSDLESTIARYLRNNVSKLKNGESVDDFAKDMATQLRNVPHHNSSRNAVDATSFGEEAIKAVNMFFDKTDNGSDERTSPTPPKSVSINRIMFQHLSLSQMAAQQMAIVTLFQQRDLLLTQRKLLPELMDRTLRTGEMYSTAPQWLQMWDTEKMKPLRVREQMLVESCFELDEKLSQTRSSLSHVRKSVHATLARELVSAMNNYDSAYDDLMVHDSRWLRRIKSIADIHRSFHERDDRQVPPPLRFVSNNNNAHVEQNEKIRRHSLKCLIWLYAQASLVSSSGGILETYLQRWARADHGRVEMGRIKGLERSFQKAYENYAGDFTCIRDLARGSIEFPTVRQICRCLRRILEDESVLVVRVKPRLAPSWDAASSGGYRDVLVNLCFKNAKSEILRQHIVEVQLHLSSFLALKHAQIGGHKTYKVARTLRVFESSRTRPCVSEVTVNQMTSVALGTVQTLDLSHLQLLPSQGIILEQAFKTAGHRSCLRELILECANEHSVSKSPRRKKTSSSSLISLETSAEDLLSPVPVPHNGSPESIVPRSSPKKRRNGEALRKMRRFSSKGPGEMRSLMQKACENSHRRRLSPTVNNKRKSSLGKKRLTGLESFISQSPEQKRPPTATQSNLARKITPDHISNMRQQWMQAANKMTNHHSRLGEMATAAAMCARNRGDTITPDNEERVKKKTKKRRSLRVDVLPRRGTFVTEGFVCPKCMFEFVTMDELKEHARKGCGTHDGGFRIERPRPPHHRRTSTQGSLRDGEISNAVDGYIDDHITEQILKAARMLLKSTPRERMSYRVIKQQLSVRFDSQELEARKGRLKDLMLSLSGVSPGEEHKIHMRMAEATANSEALSMTKSLYGMEESHTILKDSIGWGTSSSSMELGDNSFHSTMSHSPGLQKGESEKDFDIAGINLDGMDSPRSASRNGLGIPQCRSIGRGLDFGGRCLRVLKLRESRVDDKGLELLLSYRFARLLQHLDLSRCETITDRGLKAVATRCFGLRFIALECCFLITDLGVKSIAKHCPSLMHVDLQRCTKVTDSGIQSVVASCSNIETLILSGCKALTDAALASFLAALRVEAEPSATRSDRRSIFEDDFFESIDENEDEQKTQDESEKKESLYRYRLQTFLESADRCDDKLCSSLIHLDLGHCRHFSDEACKLLAESCMRLETLSLDQCSKISDLGVTAIANNCQSLRCLSLNMCTKITDASVSKLAMCCSQLESLGLWCCPEISDASLQALGERALSLRHLNVKSCPQISDRGLELLTKGCKQLCTFALQRCGVTGKGIVALAKGCDLKSLEIGALPITDNVLRQVSRDCKNLESITLFNCDAITCEGLRFVLRYCIELQDIDIWSCKNFSGEIKSVPEAFMYVSSSSGDTSSISRVDTGDLARISKALDNISKRLSI